MRLTISTRAWVGLLEFQLPDGSTKTMPVVGIVQDTAASAGDFLASPYGYITMDTLPYLGQPELFNRALVTVSEGGDDIFHIRDMGAKLKDKLEKNDSIVIRLRFSETHKHPLADTVNAILGILLALGILIVFLSSSLIANTLNALLNQHLRYIGVIKLVGGQRRQVFFMYLTLIMAFGILALLIAVPLGGQGAYGLALFIAGKLNFNILGYRIVPTALIVQILVGLLVPLIAGLVACHSTDRASRSCALSAEALADDEKQAKGGEEAASLVRLDAGQSDAYPCQTRDPHPASVCDFAAEYIPAKESPGVDLVHAHDGRRDLYRRVQRARHAA